MRCSKVTPSHEPPEAVESTRAWLIRFSPLAVLSARKARSWPMPPVSAREPPPEKADADPARGGAGIGELGSPRGADRATAAPSMAGRGPECSFRRGPW